MRRMTTGLLIAALAISACGTEVGGIDLPDKEASPVLQVRIEGGFVPVEFFLGQGPLYTVLADGRLVMEGPVIAIHPGPLVPNYQVTTISEEQLRSVLEVVQKMGLPDMTSETDDSAAARVADASTHLVTYWDDNGAHTYSVYALGILEDASARPATLAFRELLTLLDQLTATGDTTAYSAEQVQYVAGPGFAGTTPDLRDWPLDNSDFRGWKTLPNGWMCQVQSGPVPDSFDDATVETVWSDPGGGEPLKLLVRPLLPGEDICFGS